MEEFTGMFALVALGWHRRRGDQPLAAEIRNVEREYQHGGIADPVPSLIQAIHDRYKVENG